MFEAHVTELLRRYIGKYVHGLDDKALKISVWQGDVVLTNLQLRQDALNELNLPIVVKAGFLGSVRLTVPWSHLGTQPVVMRLDRLFILAGRASDASNMSEEEVFVHRQEEKRRKVEAAEAAWVEARQRLKEVAKAGALAAALDGVVEGSDKEGDADKGKEKGKDKEGGEEEGGKGQTWLSSLLNTIVGNVQLSITNVHVRYEDSNSFSLGNGLPFSFGLTLGKLAAVTIDEHDKETFVTSHPMDQVSKRVDLGQLSLYHEPGAQPWKPDKPWKDMGVAEWDMLFLPRITAQSEGRGPLRFQSPREQGRGLGAVLPPSTTRPPQGGLVLAPSGDPIHYLLRPVSAVMYYNRASMTALQRRPEPDLPRHKVRVQFQAVTLSLSEAQYSELLQLLENLSHSEERAQLAHLRPRVGVKGHADRWWRFGYESVLLRQRKRRTHLAWDRIQAVCRCRRNYVRAYANRLLNQAKQGAAKGGKGGGAKAGSAGAQAGMQQQLEATALAAMEEQLDFEVIVLFRCLAHVQVEPQIREAQAAAGAGEASKSSWFGWWGAKGAGDATKGVAATAQDGEGGAPAPSVEDTVAAQLSDDEWRKLNELIHYHPGNEEDSVTSMGSGAGDASGKVLLMVDLDVAVQRGSIELLASEPSPGAPDTVIVESSMELLRVQVRMFSSDTVTVDVALQSYGLVSTSGEIVQAGPVPGFASALCVQYLQHPVDNSADAKVTVTVAPMQVTILSAPLLRIARFFANKAPDVPMAWQSAAAAQWAQLTRSAKEQLQIALDERKRVVLHLDVHAPKVALPLTPFGPYEHQTMVLDFGHFMLDSGSGEQLGMSADDAQLYETFIIKCADIAGVLVRGDHFSWDRLNLEGMEGPASGTGVASAPPNQRAGDAKAPGGGPLKYHGHQQMTILNRCGLDIKVALIRKELLGYPALCVDLAVPSVRLHVSPRRYHCLMRSIDLLLPPNETDPFAVFYAAELAQNKGVGGSGRGPRSGQLQPWEQAAHVGTVRVLTWGGIGYRTARWRRQWVAVTEKALFVLEHRAAPSCVRMSSFAGKQVFPVPPEAIAGHEHVIAVWDKHKEPSKVVESRTAVILQLRDAADKEAWMHALNAEIYGRKPAAPSYLLDEGVATPGGTSPGAPEDAARAGAGTASAIGEEKSPVPQGGNPGLMERLRLTGVLGEARLSVHGELSDQWAVTGEEIPLVELRARTSKLRVVSRLCDHLVEMKLHALEAADLLHGGVAPSTRYLICSSEHASPEFMQEYASLQGQGAQELSTLDEEGSDVASPVAGDGSGLKVCVAGETGTPRVRARPPTMDRSFDRSESQYYDASDQLAPPEEEKSLEEPSDYLVDLRVGVWGVDSVDYAGVDTQLTLVLGALFVFCNRRTVKALMEWGLAMANDPSANKPAIQRASLDEEAEGDAVDKGAAVGRDKEPGSAVSSPRLPLDKEADKEASASDLRLLGRGRDRVIFRLHMSMQRSLLALNYEDGSLLSVLEMKELGLNLKVYPERLWVKTTLGNLRVSDMRVPRNHSYRWVCDVKSGQRDSLVDVEYESFVPDDPDYAGYEHSVVARLASVRLVYLHRFVQEVVDYCLCIVSKGALDVATAMIAEGASHALKVPAAQLEGQPAVKLEVRMEEPTILLPRATSSDEYLELDLGDMQLTNAVHWVGGGKENMHAIRLDTMLVTLTGMNLKAGLGEPVLQRSSPITVTVRRALRDVYRTLPEVDVEVKMAYLQALLSDREYRLIIAVPADNFSERVNLAPDWQLPATSARKDGPGAPPQPRGLLPPLCATRPTPSSNVAKGKEAATGGGVGAAASSLMSMLSSSPASECPSRGGDGAGASTASAETDGSRQSPSVLTVAVPSPNDKEGGALGEAAGGRALLAPASTFVRVTVNVENVKVALFSGVARQAMLAVMKASKLWVVYRGISDGGMQVMLSLPYVVVLDKRKDASREQCVALAPFVSNTAEDWVDQDWAMSEADMDVEAGAALTPVQPAGAELTPSASSTSLENVAGASASNGPRVKTHMMMVMMDYVAASPKAGGDQTLHLTLQKPWVSVAVPFLCALLKFFVPDLMQPSAASGKKPSVPLPAIEEALAANQPSGPRGGDITLSGDIWLSCGAYKQAETDVWLHPKRRLIADCSNVAFFVYNGQGHRLHLPPMSPHHRSLPHLTVPLIRIGSRKSLQFRNIKITNAHLLDRYVQLGEDSSYSVSPEDGVELVFGDADRDASLYADIGGAGASTLGSTPPPAVAEAAPAEVAPLVVRTSPRRTNISLQVTSVQLVLFDADEREGIKGGGSSGIRISADARIWYCFDSGGDTIIRLRAGGVKGSDLQSQSILDPFDVTANVSNVAGVQKATLQLDHLLVRLSFTLARSLLRIANELQSALSPPPMAPTYKCTKFRLIWKGKAPSGETLSFWRPVAVWGYSIVADCVQCGEDRPSYPVLAVLDLKVDSRHPLSYMLVHRFGTPLEGQEGQGGGRQSSDVCSIWYPVAPPGYVALGCVAKPGTERPRRSLVVCVARHQVTSAHVAECPLSAHVDALLAVKPSGSPRADAVPPGPVPSTSIQIWRVDNRFASFVVVGPIGATMPQSMVCGPSMLCASEDTLKELATGMLARGGSDAGSDDASSGHGAGLERGVSALLASTSGGGVPVDLLFDLRDSVAMDEESFSEDMEESLEEDADSAARAQVYEEMTLWAASSVLQRHSRGRRLLLEGGRGAGASGKGGLPSMYDASARGQDAGPELAQLRPQLARSVSCARTFGIATRFDHIWSERKGKGRKCRLSIWRPSKKGYASLGDVIMPGPNPPQDAVVILDQGPLRARYALPVSMHPVWVDMGTRSGLGAISIWQPIPPKGYVALGFVASPTNSQPPLDAVRCLQQSIVVPAPLDFDASVSIPGEKASGPCSFFPIRNKSKTFVVKRGALMEVEEMGSWCWDFKDLKVDPDHETRIAADIHVARMKLIIFDELAGMKVPLVDVTLQNVATGTRGVPEHLTALGMAELGVNSYNQTLRKWEPMLEPCMAKVEYKWTDLNTEHSLPPSATMEISAGPIANFVVSHGAVDSLLSASSSWAEGASAVDDDDDSVDGDTTRVVDDEGQAEDGDDEVGELLHSPSQPLSPFAEQGMLGATRSLDASQVPFDYAKEQCVEVINQLGMTVYTRLDYNDFVEVKEVPTTGPTMLRLPAPPMTEALLYGAHQPLFSPPQRYVGVKVLKFLGGMFQSRPGSQECLCTLSIISLDTSSANSLMAAGPTGASPSSGTAPPSATGGLLEGDVDMVMMRTKAAPVVLPPVDADDPRPTVTWNEEFIFEVPHGGAPTLLLVTLSEMTANGATGVTLGEVTIPLNKHAGAWASSQVTPGSARDSAVEGSPHPPSWMASRTRRVYESFYTVETPQLSSAAEAESPVGSHSSPFSSNAAPPNRPPPRPFSRSRTRTGRPARCELLLGLWMFEDKRPEASLVAERAQFAGEQGRDAGVKEAKGAQVADASSKVAIALAESGPFYPMRHKVTVSTAPLKMGTAEIATENVLVNGRMCMRWRSLVMVHNKTDVELEWSTCPIGFPPYTEAFDGGHNLGLRSPGITHGRRHVESVVEEQFENQRYRPFKGWGSAGHLLATERKQFSNRDGTRSQWEMMTFDLPRGWSWVSDWRLDRTGYVSREGWAYYPDFSRAKFPPKPKNAKSSTVSLVRRRRWVRERVKVMVDDADSLARAAAAGHSSQAEEAALRGWRRTDLGVLEVGGAAPLPLPILLQGLLGGGQGAGSSSGAEPLFAHKAEFIQLQLRPRVRQRTPQEGKDAAGKEGDCEGKDEGGSSTQRRASRPGHAWSMPRSEDGTFVVNKLRSMAQLLACQPVTPDGRLKSVVMPIPGEEGPLHLWACVEPMYLTREVGDPVLDWRVEVRAPLTLENLLPVAATYHLYGGAYPGGGGSGAGAGGSNVAVPLCSGAVASGASVGIYSVDIQYPVWLTWQPEDWRMVAKTVLLWHPSSSLPASFEVQHARSSRKLRLCIERNLGMMEHSPKHMVFYVPYFLVNDSPLSLAYLVYNVVEASMAAANAAASSSLGGSSRGGGGDSERDRERESSEDMQLGTGSAANASDWLDTTGVLDDHAQRYMMGEKRRVNAASALATIDPRGPSARVLGEPTMLLPGMEADPLMFTTPSRGHCLAFSFALGGGDGGRGQSRFTPVLLLPEAMRTEETVIQKTDGSAVGLAIRVEVGKQGFERTKVIRIVPSLSLVNHAGQSLFWRQHKHTAEHELPAGCPATALHLPDPDCPFMIEVRTEGCQWSRPLPLQLVYAKGVTRFYLVLRQDDWYRRVMLVTVSPAETNAVDGRKAGLTFQGLDVKAPYRIENHTGTAIQYRQAGEADLPVDVLQPRRSVSYAWDNILGKNELEIAPLPAPATEGTAGAATTPQAPALRPSPTPFRRVTLSRNRHWRQVLPPMEATRMPALVLEVLQEAAQVVLRITEAGVGATPYGGGSGYFNKVELGGKAAVARSRESRESDASAAASSSYLASATPGVGAMGPPTFSLLVSFKELGVSLVDQTPEELLYLNLCDLGINYTTNAGVDKYRLTVRLKALQVDNQLTLTAMPVLIAPDRKFLPGEPTPRENLLFLEVARGPSPRSIVNYSRIILQVETEQLRMSVHEPIVWRLLDMYKSLVLRVPDAISGQADPDTVEAVDVDPIVSVRLLRVSGVKINLRFLTAPMQRPAGGMGSWGALVSSFGNLDVNLKLEEVVRERVNDRSSLLVKAAYNYGIRQLLNQALHLIGGLDVLTNVQTAIGTASDKIARISYDKKFIRERQEKERASTVDHVGDGLLQGGEALAKGVFRGITGIVTKPLEGARDQGLAGFLTGIGKGVVGVAAQPMSGVLDLMSKGVAGVNATWEDLRDAISNEEEVQRYRLPRAISGDRTIRPYDEHAAQGQLILHMAERGLYFGHRDVFKEHSKFAYSDSYEFHHYLPKDRIILVTDHRVILLMPPIQVSRVDLRRDPCLVVWNVEWRDLLALELVNGTPPSRLRIHLKRPSRDARVFDSAEIERVVRCEEGSEDALKIRDVIRRTKRKYTRIWDGAPPKEMEGTLTRADKGFTAGLAAGAMMGLVGGPALPITMPVMATVGAIAGMYGNNIQSKIAKTRQKLMGAVQGGGLQANTGTARSSGQGGARMPPQQPGMGRGHGVGGGSIRERIKERLAGSGRALLRGTDASGTGAQHAGGASSSSAGGREAEGQVAELDPLSGPAQHDAQPLPVAVEVTDFDLVWKARGGYGETQFSIWRPKCPPRYASVGDVISHHRGPPFSAAVYLTKEHGRAGRWMVEPEFFDLIWRNGDGGSSSDNPLTLWKPQAPPGFVALGCVAVAAFEEPSSNVVCCIRQDLVTQSTFFDSATWKSPRSSMWPCSIWQVDGEAQAFVAYREHKRPSTDMAFMPILSTSSD